MAERSEDRALARTDLTPVKLPIDIIVSILIQDNALLGMSHYLSKEIGKRARPYRISRLITLPPTRREIETLKYPQGYYSTFLPEDGKSYYSYGSIDMGQCSKFVISISPGHETTTYWTDWHENARVSGTLDLFNSKHIYAKRGADHGSRLAKETLSGMYKDRRTLGQLIRIHTALYVHVAVVKSGKINFLYRNLQGSMNQPWESESGGALMKEVEEWYSLIMEML